MSRTYAVVWSENGSTASGRLDAFGDRFELDTRTQHVSIPFAEVEDASIERGRASRLRGLPVLQLGRIGRPPLCIASLEGTAVLHELFDQIERTSLAR